MGRRTGDVEAARLTEPPKKRLRTVSETLNVQSTVKIDKPLPHGEILTDVTQKQWKIGKPIGCGSFGEIYLASDDVASEVTTENSRYVIKIEPHSNGPLFVEIHCLIRSARHSKINKWKKDKKLNSIGMPHYIANGSHLLGETRYRFLVLPRYDCDIEKILNFTNPRQISNKNVLILAAQIIDVLEYIHAHGYTHSDIKSSNLMVGFDGSVFNEHKSPSKDSEEIDLKKSLTKSAKPKTKFSSYYYDEDFILHNYLSSASNTDCETDDERNFSERKSRATKILRMDKNSRLKKSGQHKNMNMKRLFNLRKIKSDVNYEDLNSSICSYDSYQELLDSNQIKDKNLFKDSDENVFDNDADHFHEAIESQSPGQVYLLDFGLASKFLNSDGSHKEFCVDQRKAHDGTLEYSSRDSHVGAHSRRSDLENLGYNIIDWLTGSLPWKTSETLANPELVHVLKKSYMDDIRRFMEISFKSQDYPKFIEKYFNYVNELDFCEKPDYRFCKNLLIDEFIANGYGGQKDMILNFCSNSPIRKKKNYSKRCNKSPSKNTPPDFLKRNAIVKVYGRENSHINSWKNDLKMDLIREGLSNDGIRKPCISRNFYVSDADLISKLRQTLLLNHDTPSKKFSPKNLRSTKKIVKKKKGGKNVQNGIGKFGNFLGSDKQYTWAEILAGNPEHIIRKEKDKNETCVDYSKNPRSRKTSNASEISVSQIEVNSSPNILSAAYLNSLNPTYAIKEVIANYKRKTQGNLTLKNDISELMFNDQRCTPSMVNVINSIEKRIRIEKQSEEKVIKSNKRKLINKILPKIDEEVEVSNRKTRASEKFTENKIETKTAPSLKVSKIKSPPRKRGRPKLNESLKKNEINIKKNTNLEHKITRTLRQRTVVLGDDANVKEITNEENQPAEQQIEKTNKNGIKKDTKKSIALPTPKKTIKTQPPAKSNTKVGKTIETRRSESKRMTRSKGKVSV